MYNDEQLREFRYRVEEDRVRRQAFKVFAGFVVAVMGFVVLMVMR